MFSEPDLCNLSILGLLTFCRMFFNFVKVKLEHIFNPQCFQAGLLSPQLSDFSVFLRFLQPLATLHIKAGELYEFQFDL